MSGRRHKVKGSRVERELVHAHRALGVEARRMPLSGAAGGEFAGDLMLTITSPDPKLGKLELRCESKARSNGEGFTTLERWLGKNHVLLLKRNRVDPMVVLPWSTWARLLIRAQDAEIMRRVVAEEEQAHGTRTNGDG